jgi:hypothetical protein
MSLNVAPPSNVARPAAIARLSAVAQPSVIARSSAIAPPSNVARPAAIARLSAVAQPSAVARSLAIAGLPAKGCVMAWVAAALLAGALLPRISPAAEINLATMSCDKYENDVLQSTLPGYTADPIDTVMWLFGFSVAKSGERAMYGDSLRAFGFALDAECKNNPATSLLEAAVTVKSKRDNPMDLTRLDCATFAGRHAALRKSDPESAATLTMWLYGYAVGLSGSHILDAGLLEKFDAGLEDQCSKHPHDSVFDALSAPNAAVPSLRPTPRPSAGSINHGKPSYSNP